MTTERKGAQCRTGSNPCLREPIHAVFAYMASTTITLNDDAYTLLKKLKKPGQSFSEVILNHLYPPAANAGELLERLTVFEHTPLVDERRMKLVEQGRKRRSKRS